MEINFVHPLDIEVEQFNSIQAALRQNIQLHNETSLHAMKYCAGVDVAYWKSGEMERGVCCIIVMDVKSMEIIETVVSHGIITIPYVPGYLAFRELPLIVETAQKLVHTPDLFLFDGNGYLHPRHMGIATHASFLLNKPTIGIAKSYFKINDTDFKMPTDAVGSFENITINEEIYGRVLRTRTNVKPIFISCGNWIDLPTATAITLNLINDESRLPVPVRLADLETKRLKRQFLACSK